MVRIRVRSHGRRDFPIGVEGPLGRSLRPVRGDEGEVRCIGSEDFAPRVGPFVRVQTCPGTLFVVLQIRSDGVLLDVKLQCIGVVIVQLAVVCDM